MQALWNSYVSIKFK